MKYARVRLHRALPDGRAAGTTIAWFELGVAKFVPSCSSMGYVPRRLRRLTIFFASVGFHLATTNN